MKLKKYYSFILAMALMWLPTTLFAFEWSSDPDDKSIFYLGQIFGIVGSVLNGTGSSLIGDLFSIFNIAVLALGGLVVSYTIILTTINTAQEGEMMGRKFSSIWIPLRSAVGMAFLLPTASGYSLIQILMMDIVLQGVHAANQVWALVADSFSGGTSAFGTINMNQGNLRNATESLFKSMVCAQVFNNELSCQLSLEGLKVGPYTKDDQLLVGIAGNNDYDTLCGGIQAGMVPPNSLDANSWFAANLSAFNYAAGNLQVAAQQVYASGDPINWTSSNVIGTAMNTLKGQISAAPQKPVEQNDQTRNAIKYGWLFAGSYYFELIASKVNSDYPTPSIIPENNDSASKSCRTKLNQYYERVPLFLQQTDVALGPAGNLSSAFSGKKLSKAAGVYDAITKPIRDLTYSFLNYLTTNQDDPVASLRKVGADIMITCETIWITVMVAGFIMMIGGCIMSGINPLCWMLGAIISVLVPILTVILTLLWGIGALLGIYLPLVPYIVYSFTALGWFLLVIETIVAAPVVALGLVSPAAETLGRASPAVLLITNVFLRPSLMVIGFVAAAKLVRAIIGMVNFGFQATVEASVTGLGIFGCIALLALYGGLVLAIIHECFSLIHILPEKVIRWIGGQAEQSQIKQQLQDVQKNVEKGAEMGSGLMKGSANWMQQKAASAKKGGGIDSIALGGGKK